MDEYVRDNMEYIEYVLRGYLHEITVVGPLRRDLMPRTRRLWGQYFPDHCPPDSILFVATRLGYSRAEPVILLACGHAEDIHMPPILETLLVAAREAASIITGGRSRRYTYMIYVIDSDREKLLVAYGSPDAPKWRSEEEAIRRAMRWVEPSQPDLTDIPAVLAEGRWSRYVKGIDCKIVCESCAKGPYRDPIDELNRKIDCDLCMDYCKDTVYYKLYSPLNDIFD